MKRINHIRCPLCGKLSRQRNYDKSPHKIEILIQEIGGNKHIRWYKSNDPIIDEVNDYIVKKLEILLASLQKEKPWHSSKSISIRVVPNTSYSITSTPSSSQSKDAI